MPAHGHLVVYASGLDVTDVTLDETERMHTNFKLSSGGEYIGLTDVDGNIVHQVSNYPQQVHDASYGFFGDEVGFIRQPTPGSINLPLVPTPQQVTHVWTNNDPANSWTVTAKPVAQHGEITDVQLNYRVMF